MTARILRALVAAFHRTRFALSRWLISTGEAIQEWAKSHGPTYEDPSGRTRCKACRKIVYKGQTEAQGAADAAMNRGTYLRAYRENRCGMWHLTSQQPRMRW